MSVSIRRARTEDIDFLLELVAHEEVEPFLGGRARLDRSGLEAELERSERAPESFGRFLIELDGASAGLMGFEVANERSKIARLERLAVHPDFRGGGVADEAAHLLQRLLFDLGYHRLELEIYGFNDRAQRHAERVGFVREGVRRRAYLRHGQYQDALLYGLIREDLEMTGNGKRWAEAYERAWLAGDAEAAAALYADDAAFRSHPFRELEHAGAYARRVYGEADARRVWFGEPVEGRDRAAVEYWAALVDKQGQELTLAGCVLLRFDDDGLVVDSRDYWHLDTGQRTPGEGWGG